MNRRAAIALLAAVLAAACTNTGAGGRQDDPVGGPGAGAVTPLPTGAPPAAVDYAPPWPDRPVVSLDFRVAADHRSVAGRETVRFTPDREVCRLVFRAWPNKPETARAGNALRVTAAVAGGHQLEIAERPAGAPAGSPGTLVTVRLPSCVAVGDSVTVTLTFRLTLGDDTPERVGRSTEDGTAWFATAFPLLAWERGRGWATEPAVDVPGETVTSEEFRLARLRVIVPARDDVMGVGELVRRKPARRPQTAVHVFRAPAVRDVAVSVGDFDVVERDVAGTRLHVAAPTAGTETPLRTWTDLTAASMERLSRLLGPFPYDDLWVTIAPDVPTGIEFPSAIQFGDVDPVVFFPLVSHEVAHMWLYALVGNNQARDPWLDEALATFAQAVADGDGRRYVGRDLPSSVIGMVGAPMSAWAEQPQNYGAGVYAQGAEVLLEARAAVGPAEFDDALRSYVAVNAHRIATPADFERAFAGLPEVLDRLGAAGALPAPTLSP